jgi:competence protein ComEC
MVYLNPRLANFDLGFQLSFLATLGIVYGPAMFKPLVAKICPAGFLAETLVATLGALVFTWPWLAYATGQVSLVALPANLLVVPMVSPLMWFGLALGALGMILPTLALVVAWPIYLILEIQIFLVKFLAGLPLAVVNLEQFLVLWLVIFYGPIIYWAVKMNKKTFLQNYAQS